MLTAADVAELFRDARTWANRQRKRAVGQLVGLHNPVAECLRVEVDVSACSSSRLILAVNGPTELKGFIGRFPLSFELSPVLIMLFSKRFFFDGQVQAAARTMSYRDRVIHRNRRDIGHRNSIQQERSTLTFTLGQNVLHTRKSFFGVIGFTITCRTQGGWGSQ